MKLRTKPFTGILCALLAGLMLVSCNPSSDDPTDTSPATDPVTEDAANTEVGDTTPVTTPETTPETDTPAPREEVEVYENGYNNSMIVGFDEYGRAVPAVTARLDDREVGIFYHLWLGATSAPQNYDMTKIREQYGDDTLFRKDVPESPGGAWHWWSEPLFGYYNSGDEWVIRKHMEMLTAAGVDFLVFDYTNAINYNAVAKRVMKISSELRAEGWDAPQVVFFTHAYSIQTMRNVYQNIYANDTYPDSWYRVDGKPMIIAYTDADMDSERTAWETGNTYHPAPLTEEEKNFFYYRQPVWPYDQNYISNYTIPTTGWPYVDWVYPQRTYGDMMVVSTSSHPAPPYSTSVTNSGAYNVNWGRGWNVRKLKNNKEDVNKGTFFQSQWDTVFRRDPKFVMITGWNEWIAIKGGSVESGFAFVDCVDIEFSRDIEPMVGGYEDAFYIQMMTNIRKYKYASMDGKIAKSVKKTIDVSGAASQWDDVNAIYRRVGQDDGKRSSRDAARKNWYKQDPVRNNLTEIRVTVDADYIYFYIKATDAIQTADDAAWMNIFIGTGSAPSMDKGWESYEYVINRSRSGNTATIEKLNADFTGETLSATAAFTVQGDVMQVSIPRAALGLDEAGDFYFKVADGVSEPSEIMNYYGSGRSLPLGRLSYLYQIGNID